MSDTTPTADRAAPDSLVALLPVQWEPDQTSLLATAHPDVWAEPCHHQPLEHGGARFQFGDDLPPITLSVDPPMEELVDAAGMAKKPFQAAELANLKAHTALWRITMEEVSQAPVERAHGFARFLATAMEAGAAGVFLPFCAQVHSPGLIKHLAVDFSQPPALINLFINAWNDDDWMVTRGLTVLGLPELETPLEGGLNDAYFRLMDVAAGMLLQRDAYPEGAHIQLGPHRYAIVEGPSGPPDRQIPLCGLYGRLTIRRPDDLVAST